MNLLHLLNPYHLTDAVRRKEPLAVQREIILQFLLIAVAIWGMAGLALYILRSGINAGNLHLALPFIVSIVILVTLMLARRLPFTLRAGGLAVLVLIEMLEAVFRQGLAGNGLIYGIGVAAIVAVLFGPRLGVISVGMVLAIHGGVGWAMLTGRLPLPTPDLIANPADFNDWISSGLAALLVASSIAVAYYQLTQGLSQALDDQKKLTGQIQVERDQLETRVQERTQELMRRAAQLEASRQVAAAIARETETVKLLTTAADVIKEQFGFYHAGIFLNDADGLYTVLQAATGEAGQKMLASGHKLLIGEVGIVGYVARRGEPRVTNDVWEDPTYYANPLLPETKSEIGVPLRHGENVIGVLDVQSTRLAAFNADDVAVISSIADQLSLALEKARLLQEYQTYLNELEATAKAATAQSWNAHLRGSRAGKRFAFQYKQARVTPVSEGGHPVQSRTAVETGQTVISAGSNGSQPEALIAVPIKLRNQPLGVVNLRVAGEKPSPELVQLVENAVNRLAISLENVRLLEELQLRAERERLVGEIGAKVRSATDVESILRTAANELGRSLGVTEVVVQLNPGK